MKKVKLTAFVLCFVLNAVLVFAQVIVGNGTTRYVSTQEYATNTNYWVVQSGGKVIINAGGTLTVGNAISSGHVDVQPGGEIIVNGSSGAYGSLVVKNGSLNLLDGTQLAHAFVTVNNYGRLMITGATIAISQNINIGSYDTIRIKSGGESVVDGGSTYVGAFNVNGGGLKVSGTSSSEGRITLNNSFCRININSNGVVELSEYGVINLSNGGQVNVNMNNGVKFAYGKISSSSVTQNIVNTSVTTPFCGTGTLNNISVSSTQDLIIPGVIDGMLSELFLNGHCAFDFTPATPVNNRKIDIIGRLHYNDASTTDYDEHLEDVNIVAPYGGMYAYGNANINRLPRVSTESGTTISCTGATTKGTWSFDSYGAINASGAVDMTNVILKPYGTCLWDGIKNYGSDVHTYNECEIEGIRPTAADSNAAIVFMPSASSSGNKVERAIITNYGYSSSRLVDGIRCIGEISNNNLVYPRTDLYDNNIQYCKSGIYTHLSNTKIYCNTSQYNSIGASFSRPYMCNTFVNHFVNNVDAGVYVTGVYNNVWLRLYNNDVKWNEKSQIHVNDYGQVGTYTTYNVGNNIIESSSYQYSQLVTLTNYGYAELYYNWWGSSTPDVSKINNTQSNTGGLSDGSGMFWLGYNRTTSVPSTCFMKYGIDGDNKVAVMSSEIQSTSYPNPFNPTATIEYTLPEEMYITIHVYSAIGGYVAEVENGVKSAGTHTVEFKANALTSGQYIYQIITPYGMKQGKMMLMK